MKVKRVVNSKVIMGFLVLAVIAVAVYHLMPWREGYDNLRSSDDIANAADLTYSMGDGVKTSWEKPVKIMQKYSGVPNFDNKMETQDTGRPPSGTKDIWFLADTKFSPDCCPSVYSNSLGCICASKEVYDYLNERGGNRTLTTEY